AGDAGQELDQPHRPQPRHAPRAGPARHRLERGRARQRRDPRHGPPGPLPRDRPGVPRAARGIEVKLHDLKPAAGSRKAKRRVGRGIAAGQGKTAGRGTKGQKARAGGTIPAWFEGGQTPLHQRIPKLRGFRNLFKVEYEVVNVGDIARVAEAGGFEGGEMPGAKASKGAAPVTVNQEILRGAGLIRRLDGPMKVLGSGDLSTPLFVVADAFSASARSKIEAAGGTVSILETP